MGRWAEVTRSYVASGAMLGAGLYVGSLGTRPEKLLELYDYETCPHCRRVREALSMLDLDARIWPCPKGGERFRPELRQRAAREQVPFLVDPNEAASVQGADAIIKHLYRCYGDGVVPALLSVPVARVGVRVATAVRLGALGRSVRPSRAPKEPLELYSFEASPYCRLAREALSSLELPYVLHNVAKKSPRRPAFIARAGKMQVPWLHDPSTGVSLFESADIVRYLEREYGA